MMTPDIQSDRRPRPGRARRSTPSARATELAILDALRAVVDPEIGMNVVELALIKQIILGANETEIKMILTTPFCPYAGSMIQQVRSRRSRLSSTTSRSRCWPSAGIRATPA